MFKVAVAHSLELDSAEAAADVLEQCRRQLGDLKPQAGLLFAGIDHDFALILKDINAVYPDIELIGCTTDGEISSVHGYADDSVTLMAFYVDELFFKAGVADNISQDTARLVRSAVDYAISELPGQPALCIVTPSGLTASGDNMLAGLKLSLGDTFPIFGGAAADLHRFAGTTYQFFRDKVFADACPFLLITGPLHYSFGVNTGWIPIGRKERVTESNNNTIYKIGNDTAVQFYQHYFGEDIEDEGHTIGEYPLAVFEDNNEFFYLRTVTFLDREKGSLAFFGNVPDGSFVQVTHSTRDSIVEAAERSIDVSDRGYPGSEPLAALCFSCSARKQVLGTRVESEYQALKNRFPDLPLAGFYTYGEIAPLEKKGPTKFHNQTLVVLMLGLR